jgi:hypothetical protein
MPYENTSITNNSTKSVTDQFNGFQSIYANAAGLALACPVVLPSNSDYFFSTNVKVTGGTFVVKIEQNTPETILYLSINLTDSTYNHVNTVFHVVSGSDLVKSLNIMISGTTGSNTAYIDKFTLVKSVCDFGSMEKSNLGWSGINCSVAKDTSGKRSGTNCLKIYSSSADAYAQSEIINTIVDESYSFYAYLKCASGSSITAKIYDNINNTVIYEFEVFDGTSYTSLNTTFTATSVETVIRFYVGVSNTCYIDDLAILPVVSITSLSEMPLTTSESYGYDHWFTNPVGSLLVNGSDLFSVGFNKETDLTSGTGSLLIRYMPLFDYNSFYEDATIFYIKDFLRVYYDSNDMLFKGSIYNGNEWIVSGCESELYTFVSGTNLDIGFTYNNEMGYWLYVTGTIQASFNGSWSAQYIEPLLCIGSISGTTSERANGYVDDIALFPKDVTLSYMYSYFMENNSYE